MVVEDEFVELSGIRLFTRKLIPEEKDIYILNQCGYHPHFDYPGKVLAAVCNFIAQD